MRLQCESSAARVSHQTCLGTIAGAKALGAEKLKRYFVNAHIERLLRESAEL